MKKINKIEMGIAIFIPLIIGVISALITKNGTALFKTVNKPPLSPPSIVFPIAWTILYILMGISSYFIFENNEIIKTNDRKKGLVLYAIQLIFNFFWSIIFFNCKAYVFAFIWLLIMLGLIILLAINAKKINNVSYYLLIPYILWVTFAGYLNFGIALLN